MPVGYGLEYFLTKPLAKFHHPLLMAGWTESPCKRLKTNPTRNTVN